MLEVLLYYIVAFAFTDTSAFVCSFFLFGKSDMSNRLKISQDLRYFIIRLLSEKNKFVSWANLWLLVIVGIEKLTDHLVKHKVPIALATGNSEYEFSLKEKGHSQFFKKFLHKVIAH